MSNGFHGVFFLSFLSYHLLQLFIADSRGRVDGRPAGFDGPERLKVTNLLGRPHH